jgi:hypothetical protein
LWREKKAAQDPGAGDALDRAIDAYDAGFAADPRDAYPGINLLTLLVERRGEGDLERVETLTPVVIFATARLGALRSGDYWTVATVLELAAIMDDEQQGRRALSAMIDLEPHDWMRETTADQLRLLVTSLEALRGTRPEWVADVAHELLPSS